MFLNNLPQPTTNPDYLALVRFLVEPFLLSCEGLKLDCEISQGGSKVWLRLALAEEDQGRLFGRWGKSIQAVRVVLGMAATQAGQSVHLEIYDEPRGGDRPDRSSERSFDNQGERLDQSFPRPSRSLDTPRPSVSKASPPIRRSQNT